MVHLGPRRLLLHWLATGRMFSMALFLASMGALIYLFVSPDFQVQQVQVQGNSVLRNEVIVELSALQQTPVWFVNTAHAQERLLQNAYIEQASIDVRLPDRAVINVVERQPEVRWQVGDMQYLLDKNGTVLDVATEPADPNTLVIVGTPSAPGQNAGLQPMDHVDPDALELARALALRLPVEIGFTPQMVGWDIALGVYVKSSSGQTIIFGRTENLDRKLAIFRHLLNDGTAFTYLDLRPSNPFYRLEG
jgi:cell division protein FtsQ